MLTVLIDNAWETYLKQLNRPDSGQKTLSMYQSMFKRFIDWIHSEYPKKTRVADVDHETALAFMQSVFCSGVSSITFNKYLQSLRLIFKHLKEPAALEANPFDDSMMLLSWPSRNRAKESLLQRNSL